MIARNDRGQRPGHAGKRPSSATCATRVAATWMRHAGSYVSPRIARVPRWERRGTWQVVAVRPESLSR